MCVPGGLTLDCLDCIAQDSVDCITWDSPGVGSNSLPLTVSCVGASPTCVLLENGGLGPPWLWRRSHC